MNKKDYIKLILRNLLIIMKRLVKINEDYSLLMRQYNEMIEKYELNIPKLIWNPDRIEFQNKSSKKMNQ